VDVGVRPRTVVWARRQGRNGRKSFKIRPGQVVDWAQPSQSGGSSPRSGLMRLQLGLTRTIRSLVADALPASRRVALSSGYIERAGWAGRQGCHLRGASIEARRAAPSISVVAIQAGQLRAKNDRICSRCPRPSSKARRPDCGDKALTPELRCRAPLRGGRGAEHCARPRTDARTEAYSGRSGGRDMSGKTFFGFKARPRRRHPAKVLLPQLPDRPAKLGFASQRGLESRSRPDRATPHGHVSSCASAPIHQRTIGRRKLAKASPSWPASA